jgi:hypothetical protein
MPITFEPLWAFLKKTILWRGIFNILPQKPKLLRFAIIYPGTVFLGPDVYGFGWVGLGIANVGTVAFDPTTVQFSIVLGNNNWPSVFDVMVDYDALADPVPYVLNPGEVSGGMSWGLSLADIQSVIPEVTAINPTPFSWRTRVFSYSGFNWADVVNTSADLNYTVTLGGASANFTTELVLAVTGFSTLKYPGFVYSA